MKIISNFCKPLAFSPTLALLLPTQIIASTLHSTLIVSARVNDVCVFPSQNFLNFGNYDRTLSQATTSIGTMTITCTKGTVISSIGLSNGRNQGEGLRRAMFGQTTGDKLHYHITKPVNVRLGYRPYPGYCPAATGTEWTNTGVGLLTPSFNKFNTTMSARIHICGQIPPGQDVGTDLNYADTVNITLNYW